MKPNRHTVTSPSTQSGAVFMIMLVILVIGSVSIFVMSLNSSTLQIERDRVTANALAKAKEALIGDTVSQPSITLAGYLRLPDLGFGIGNVPAEGSPPPNFSGNSADFSVIGKVPWKNLGIAPSHDGQNECLWYVVSGRFKNNPTTNSAFNWDTLGQIDVIDGSGNIISSNIVALLVAPGHPIDGQNHTLSDPTYTQCGGNYDARNYLDSYNSADAVSGEVNYFTSSTNNRIALNANNKRFVMTNNNHYNDQFLFVTTDDIFRPIIRRSDFSAQIFALMNDAVFITHLQSVVIAGAKGTNNVNCNNTSNLANKNFCNNWLEMLLLATLPTPSSVTIDGAPTAVCTSVLIFGGQKSATQVRITTADKSAPANYLEGTNSTAFATPTATTSNFTGASTFNANTPSADLLRCIP